MSRCRSRRPAQGENPALRSTERNQRDQAGAIPYPVVSWAFTMVATGRIRCSCMACHRVFRSGRSGHPPRERGRGRDSSVHARKGGSSRQGRSWTARWAWRRFSHRPNGQASGTGVGGVHGGAGGAAPPPWDRCLEPLFVMGLCATTGTAVARFCSTRRPRTRCRARGKCW